MRSMWPESRASRGSLDGGKMSEGSLVCGGIKTPRFRWEDQPDFPESKRRYHRKTQSGIFHECLTHAGRTSAHDGEAIRFREGQRSASAVADAPARAVSR